MKNTIVPFVLLVSIILIGGCSKRPSDFPQTFPCTITITKAGQPLANATVVLVSESESGPWVTSGTSVSGPITIKTRWNDYEANGAPAGNYKVLVDALFDKPDAPQIDEVTTDQETAAKIMADYEKKINALRVVSPRYNDVNETPFTLTVTQTGTNATFDIKD